MSRRYRVPSIIMFVLAGVVAACATSAPLNMRLSNPSAVSSAKSITVRPFTTEDVAQSYKDAAGLAQDMATALRDNLRALGVAAEIAQADSITSDLVLEGKFTNIDEGSGAGRVLLGTGGATVAVRGLLKTRSGETVAEFTKSKTSAGGPLGLGGGFAGDPGGIIRNNAKSIAAELAKSIKGKMR
jgi:hypothetical protein